MLQSPCRSRHACILAIVLTTTSMAALSAFAASVTPPPRTMVSGSIVIEPGDTSEARARHGRERTNVVRNKRDFTRDDSGPGKASPAIPAKPGDTRATPATPPKPGRSPAAQSGPKTLILYDAPAGDQYEKLGFAYAIMLRNLLGHFDATVDMQPINQYTAGKLEKYNQTFYLGSYYDNTVPPAFLQDVSTTTKTVAWFRYNIWQLAWDASYGFTQRYGLAFAGLRGLNSAPGPSNPNPGFFDDVIYKNRDFIKYYAYNAATGAINADPDIGAMQVADAAKATVVVPVKNRATGEVAPYVVRSGNFWYFADNPFSYIGPRDRYLVFADLLHDIVGIDHPEGPDSHKGLVRLEDVDALVNPSHMTTLTNYLHQKAIPFSIAAIALYMDPLGKYNNGIPLNVPLSQASNLKSSLDYALARGGSIVAHGYTHQYSNVPNLHTAVSADDFEFWDATHNRPVEEDSFAWAKGRMQSGLNDLLANGYTPIAWETPHYQGSANANRAAGSTFATTYQRVVYYTADRPDFSAAVARDFSVGQFYPYVIQRDYYGQKVLPENLGNIEYDISHIDPTSNIVYTWQDLYTNAQFALAVRDGAGSFFFHPFWLESSLKLNAFSDFQSLIEGMTALGYKWTAASNLSP